MKRYFQVVPGPIESSVNHQSVENVDGQPPLKNSRIGAIPTDANLIENMPEVNSSISPKRSELSALEVSDVPTSTHSISEMVTPSSTNEIIRDLGLRIQICDYHPNDQDHIRREYLLAGSCQPHKHTFPQTMIGKKKRRFNKTWFKEFSTWLEYSIGKDACFCLYCYLFKSKKEQEIESGYSFVVDRFKNWKRSDKFGIHVGICYSFHNQARRKCEALLNEKQYVRTFLHKKSDRDRSEYWVRLNASLVCIKYLLWQGLAFRGHDESEESNDRGNFLELLRALANSNDAIKSLVLKNAPRNDKLTSLDIQKDVVRVCAAETTLVIMQELGSSLFSILIDESRDISTKEQMAVVFRFVNDKGQVVERFIGLVHVSDTRAVSLEKKIDDLLCEHKLSIARLRGQGYDGASNMRGEFNGLKALILKENGAAFYVHCFVHQLQLALVGVATNHDLVETIFFTVSSVANLVGASCKRCDMLKEKQATYVLNALLTGELQSGRGLNQETMLKRAGDTRWSSHFGALVSLIVVFSAACDVLDDISWDGSKEQKREARNLLATMHSFDFALSLFLMKNILGITNTLSQVLQRKDQDIVNAMDLVKVSKLQLQMMREDGWDDLFDEACSFCNKHKIVIPNMDGEFEPIFRSKRHTHGVTNQHHYQVQLFYTVIDMQLQELNNRFNEGNTELLIYMATLSPIDSFSAFEKKKLIRLANLYPADFSSMELLTLGYELDTYVMDVRANNEFSSVKGITGLAEKMVEKKKNILYPLVYKLITLALILHVATATVERAFSAMSIVKTRLRNSIGDEFMNDCMITYVEKKLFDDIQNDVIINRFQKMRPRRGQL